MNREPVCLALIGAGVIGVRHLKLAADEPECRLVAIVDPASQAEATANEVGCSRYVMPANK